ncbi:rfaE bifunctional protein [Nitrosococcus halophilus Nc 4]|uniref:Bifunctional protein HldE n=1 Tax=Nitrosococcus halophilus (strain Nc4) TaxID=472759 RepID=D5C0E7_NITHN|nr:bifunctional D-glycero-beta-D-manno-heptose-7-phosphate kinase/D-glycero-beta-D-manno-heptose 1-phosphate adenylyltransferase HldE [Nitrosococcus halophilus]ADE14473.1 rfaE bifunctional protein [Nitrosococcus halophilus Nc 4]
MKIEFPDFSKCRVLVVGDVMLDRYWHGGTSRISPEAPVPVVCVKDMEERPGGAANVALNLSALGLEPLLMGLVGDDVAADTLTEKLEAAGVSCGFHRVGGIATTAKLRVLSSHQQLIRLDFDSPFPRAAADAITELFYSALRKVEVVVFSDYGKGTLSAVSDLIAAAQTAGKWILVDPKGRDFSIYRGANLLTPNLAEFEAVVGRCPDEASLSQRGRELVGHLGLTGLLITRGEQGMTLIPAAGAELHLPTQAREVFDVTGAGDTVIAVLAAGLAAGLCLEKAIALSNVAAGLVVGKLGTAVVSPSELRQAFMVEAESGKGILNEEQLLLAVADARAQGETIVMTNGCFDILHAGHVAYLEMAKCRGDRLIVAVNDDASVRALKGNGRPLNNIQRRMAVLAGLKSVDWVVPFSEVTPERLICRIAPDLLVKGGDYTPQKIAGYDCVKAAGGEVEVMGFEPGVSSSTIIERIRSEYVANIKERA